MAAVLSLLDPHQAAHNASHISTAVHRHRLQPSLHLHAGRVAAPIESADATRRTATAHASTVVCAAHGEGPRYRGTRISLKITGSTAFDAAVDLGGSSL